MLFCVQIFCLVCILCCVWISVFSVCCYFNNNNNNNCTSNNWSHWNSNEKLKEKFGSCTRKTFDRFATKDSYTWNFTHNTENTAMWSLWGSPLVQEKYQEEKACDKTHPYRIIIVIILITIIYTLLFVIVIKHEFPFTHYNYK